MRRRPWTCRKDLAGRWAAACGAVRGWALANPNEYALIYGTPVPGYVAPAATIASVGRVSSVLLGILRDIDAGRLAPAPADDDVPPDDRQALAPARSIVGPQTPDGLLHQGFAPNLASAWLTSFAIGAAVAIPTAILVAPSARRLAGHLTGTPRNSPPGNRQQAGSGE